MRAAPAESDRYSHLPADDETRLLTVHESQYIEHRAAELMAERMADPDQFSDMCTALEHSDLYQHLQAIVANSDNACSGDAIALRLVARAGAEITTMIRRAANEAWLDECQAIAEREL